VRVGHAFVSLGLVGALACGWSMTATTFTSDAMSSAVAPRGAFPGKTLTAIDEVSVLHRDDNIDDMSTPSNFGLTVEIEIPRELEVLPGRRVDTPDGFS